MPDGCDLLGVIYDSKKEVLRRYKGKGCFQPFSFVVKNISWVYNVAIIVKAVIV